MGVLARPTHPNFKNSHFRESHDSHVPVTKPPTYHHVVHHVDTHVAVVSGAAGEHDQGAISRINRPGAGSASHGGGGGGGGAVHHTDFTEVYAEIQSNQADPCHPDRHDSAPGSLGVEETLVYFLLALLLIFLFIQMARCIRTTLDPYHTFARAAWFETLTKVRRTAEVAVVVV